MARSGVGTKRVFETVFKAMVSVLERSVADKRARRPEQAIAALCVGGMVVARSMAARARADELREACKSVALKLGGWEKYGARGRAKGRIREE